MIEELSSKHNGIYNTSMLPKPETKYLQPAAYRRQNSSFIDRDFQLKYTRYILGMALVSTAIFLLPVFYFSNQNYSIFFKLADLMNPELANYIARERLGFNIIFSAVFLGNLAFWAIFSKKMTAKIAGPAKILRNHIRLLSRGDYTRAPVRLREDDEFKELINTYNYLYTLLKVQNERELKELDNIHGSITNPIAHKLIGQMIDERKHRLKTSSGEPHAEAHDSLHAS